jgi:succinyl-diaminopimelate desuccinylase
MVQDKITRDDVASLLTDMVAIPSINPAFRKPGLPAEWFGEARVAAFIAGWLKAEGIETDTEEVLPGRPNVVARLPGAAGAPRMIWEGHTDTVQVEGMHAPFTPRIEGSRLYGRGAVDDKGCLAMFMLAIRAAKQRGTQCELTFVAAVDEEVTFKGVQHHIGNHGPYDLGIAGEPTGLAVVSACKGVIRFVIEVQGQSAHSAMPEEGINALTIGSALIARLSDYMASMERSHPLLGRRTLTCTMMQAGEGPNTVPPRATMTFDFRTLPDQTGAEAWSEIASVVRAFAETKGEGAAIVMHPPFIDSVSMEVPHGSAIVRELARVVGEAGYPSEIIGVPYGSDASKLTRAGTPCVIFGPGRIEQAHAIDEYVDMDEVVRGAEMLVALASRL